MKRFQFETKTILNLALPALLTQASYTLTSMFDLMMVGSLSPEAIAGVGVGGILFWNLAVLFAGPLMAMGYLCAQSYGAGNHEQFFRRASAAFILSIVPAIFIGIFNMRGSILLYRILGAEPEVVRIGTEYFRFRLIGFPFELANMGMESMIKATGNTKRPMIIRFISHLSNLLLNYILIFGKFGFPRMEAAGAGLATLISYLVATALFVIYVFRTFKRPENKPLFPLPDRSSVTLTIKEGLKIAGNELAGSLSFLVYTGIVARLGAAALAANEIGINIVSTAFLPAVGLGQAAMILIGQRIGAGNTHLARKVGFEVEMYCAIFMLGMGIFFLLSPQIIGRLYTKDPEVLSYLIPMIRFGAFFQIFDGGQIVFSFCLRGAGDTTYLFLVNLLGSWIVFIPATLLIVHVLGKGVIWTWACMYGLMFLFFIAYGIRYGTLKWDRIKAK